MSKSYPSVNIIAEIGINHNGDMDLAKRMISLAAVSGCNQAKFQKRDPDVCVPEAQKSKMRDTPWGRMTYLDQKKRIEFTGEQMLELYRYAASQGIELFASVWDKPSVDVMAEFTRVAKIGSAKITDLELCRQAREKFDFLIISTGMSTEEEIVACVEACRPDVIMHTNSTYPTQVGELNLRYIQHLYERWGNRAEIGQSGHEQGLVTTFAAVAMGATWVERHVTLDRGMWGSDQSSSIEPSGLFKLVKGIRDIEAATQFPPGERRQFSGEVAKRVSLRG